MQRAVANAYAIHKFDKGTMEGHGATYAGYPRSSCSILSRYQVCIKLEKKYGQVNIDLVTGEYVSNESNKED